MTDDRLTLLSEYFHPESSSTSQLLTELATGLTEEFDVSCLTTSPNYHASDQDLEVPRQELYDGVKITRVCSTRFNKDNLPKRIVNWATYTIVATARLLSASTDIVLVVSNPPTIPLAAWIRKQIRDTAYVYLIHDLYPDIAVELGFVTEGTLIERIWRRVNKQLLQDADRIIVLGESMRDEVLTRYGSVDDSQLVVIHNWEDESFIQPMPKSENEFARKHDTVDHFTITYSGNIGRFHELKTVIEAVNKLSKEGYDVKFLVIGEGARKSNLQNYVSENEIDAVDFLPFQPIERLDESLTCGDISLVGIKEGMGGLCVSLKLYSARAAGQPILAAVGEDDEVATLVRECDCGYHVEPNDVDVCVEAIKRWINNPGIQQTHGKNARCCLENRFSFEEARKRYKDTLTEVLED